MVYSTSTIITVTKPAVKGREGEPGQMGVAAIHKYREGAYWARRGKKSLGDPIRNVLITTLSTFAIMLILSL